MPVEALRKRFMAQQVQWGDPVSSVSPPHSRSGEARGDAHNTRLQDIDAMIVDNMNAVVPTSSPPAISAKGWSLQKLIAAGKRFKQVPRVSASAHSLSAEIAKHEGIPLIIDGWHNHPGWRKDRFNIDWFGQHGVKELKVRNVCDWSDRTMPLDEFIDCARQTPTFAVAGEQERLYGKDAPCPPEWNDFLHKSNVLPSSLLPGHANLLLNLPQERAVETLMCYLGIGDTFTPCHKDLCASSGQNLMMYAENGGSSFWFMTASSDAPEVTRFFHEELQQELDHETHVITIDELAKAPFTVYIAEQKVGDLVLVPPRSSHQVVNYGGMTIKMSWSRMTLPGLKMALYYELPLYRRVCRAETYCVKATIYHTLLRTLEELELHNPPKSPSATSNSSTSRTPTPALTRLPISSSRNEPSMTAQSHKSHLLDQVMSLLELYDYVLIEEYPHNYSVNMLPPEKLSEPSQSCDFCGADIFQSFFECCNCVDSVDNGMDVISGSKVSSGDGFVICPGCYAEGRSCKCQSMSAMQARPFEELLETRSRAIRFLQASGRRPKSALERDLLSDRHLGLFRAACALRRTREIKKDTRTCSVARRKEKSHGIQYAWALNCRECHCSSCFSHMVFDQQVHSAEALLAHDKDKTHREYHRVHKQGRDIFDREEPKLRTNEKEGRFPNLGVQLVHLAKTYTTCKPVNPTWMQAGWYDLILQIISSPSEEVGRAVEENCAEMPRSASELSSLTDCPPSIDDNSLQERLPPIKESITGTVKRLVFDFVLVPPPSWGKQAFTTSVKVIPRKLGSNHVPQDADMPLANKNVLKLLPKAAEKTSKDGPQQRNASSSKDGRTEASLAKVSGAQFHARLKEISVGTKSSTQLQSKSTDQIRSTSKRQLQKQTSSASNEAVSRSYTSTEASTSKDTSTSKRQLQKQTLSASNEAVSRSYVSTEASTSKDTSTSKRQLQKQTLSASNEAMSRSYTSTEASTSKNTITSKSQLPTVFAPSQATLTTARRNPSPSEDEEDERPLKRPRRTVQAIRFKNHSPSTSQLSRNDGNSMSSLARVMNQASTRNSRMPEPLAGPSGSRSTVPSGFSKRSAGRSHLDKDSCEASLRQEVESLSQEVAKLKDRIDEGSGSSSKQRPTAGNSSRPITFIDASDLRADNQQLRARVQQLETGDSPAQANGVVDPSVTMVGQLAKAFLLIGNAIAQHGSSTAVEKPQSRHSPSERGQYRGRGRGRGTRGRGYYGQYLHSQHRANSTTYRRHYPREDHYPAAEWPMPVYEDAYTGFYRGDQYWERTGGPEGYDSPTSYLYNGEHDAGIRQEGVDPLSDRGWQPSAAWINRRHQRSSSRWSPTLDDVHREEPQQYPVSQRPQGSAVSGADASSSRVHFAQAPREVSDKLPSYDVPTPNVERNADDAVDTAPAISSARSDANAVPDPVLRPVVRIQTATDTQRAVSPGHDYWEDNYEQ